LRNVGLETTEHQVQSNQASHFDCIAMMPKLEQIRRANCREKLAVMPLTAEEK